MNIKINIHMYKCLHKCMHVHRTNQLPQHTKDGTTPSDCDIVPYGYLHYEHWLSSHQPGLAWAPHPCYSSSNARHWESYTTLHDAWKLAQHLIIRDYNASTCSKIRDTNTTRLLKNTFFYSHRAHALKSMIKSLCTYTIH